MSNTNARESSVIRQSKGRLHPPLFSLSSYDLHKRLVNNYLLSQKGATVQLKRDTSRDKRDIDVIRENHRFLWDDAEGVDTWEQRLAKKYYDKLFKEYCICDLSRFKENKVAMRWRTEQELVVGKGQFICGEKGCQLKETLRTWEVNFAYDEHGKKHNALVKLRLCPECSNKLNYHHMKREIISTRTRKRNLDGDLKSKQKDKKRKSNTHVNDTQESVATTSEVDLTKNEEQEKDKEDVKAWKVAQNTDEKSREEEFQDYLEQLFF